MDYLAVLAIIIKSIVIGYLSSMSMASCDRRQDRNIWIILESFQ